MNHHVPGAVIVGERCRVPPVLENQYRVVKLASKQKQQDHFDLGYTGVSQIPIILSPVEVKQKSNCQLIASKENLSQFERSTKIGKKYSLQIVPSLNPWNHAILFQDGHNFWPRNTILGSILCTHLHASNILLNQPIHKTLKHLICVTLTKKENWRIFLLICSTSCLIVCCVFTL